MGHVFTLSFISLKKKKKLAAQIAEVILAPYVLPSTTPLTPSLDVQDHEV